MMRAFSKVLCGAGFASLQVLGRRIEGTTLPQLNMMDETRPGDSLVETGSSWETVDTSFCTSNEHEFGCDEDSVIIVKTARYSKAKKLRKTGDKCEENDAGTADGCSPTFDEEVANKCNGEQTCKFQAGEHRKCGFRTMRVVYECDTREPDADDEVAAHFENEEVDDQQPLPHNEVVKQLPEQEEQEVQTTSTSTTTPYEHRPVQPLPEQEVTTSTTTPNRQDRQPLQPVYHQGEIVSTQVGNPIKQPAQQVKVKGTKGIHREKALNVDKEAEISMDLCYRSSRTSKLWKNGIFHMWAGSTERLVTRCGEFEGCFKVQFLDDDGNEYWYEDENAEPSQKQLFAGDIEVTGFFNWREYMSTLWGIGIRRNDAWTWGVCLPKTRGVRFAIQRWDFLQTLHKYGI